MDETTSRIGNRFKTVIRKRYFTSKYVALKRLYSVEKKWLKTLIILDYHNKNYCRNLNLEEAERKKNSLKFKLFFVNWTWFIETITGNFVEISATTNYDYGRY